MLDLCDAEHIIFLYEALEDKLNGIYITCDGMSTIILSNRIKDNHPLRNIVLAEELGHHFTLIGCNIPKEHWNRLDRMNFTKNEFRAIRWAAKYLIPIADLYAAHADGITTIPELAEYFSVTPNFVRFRMTLPDIQTWKYQEVI